MMRVAPLLRRRELFHLLACQLRAVYRRRLQAGGLLRELRAMADQPVLPVLPVAEELCVHLQH
jgi:hypothetical protein